MTLSQILFALFALAFVQMAKSQTTECTDAISALSDQCIYLLNTLDPAACSGTCGTQWAAVYSDCPSSGFNSNVRRIHGVYETTCLSGAACMSDLRALNADSSCVDALNYGLTDVYCTGNCRDLIEDAFDTCPMNEGFSQADYNEVCGSSSILQASGIITVLVVAISALFA